MVEDLMPHQWGDEEGEYFFSELFKMAKNF